MFNTQLENLNLITKSKNVNVNRVKGELNSICENLQREEVDLKSIKCLMQALQSLQFKPLSKHLVKVFKILLCKKILPELTEFTLNSLIDFLQSKIIEKNDCSELTFICIDLLLSEFSEVFVRILSAELLVLLINHCTVNKDILVGKNEKGPSDHLKKIRFLLPNAGELDLQMFIIEILFRCVPNNPKKKELYLLNLSLNDDNFKRIDRENFQEESRIYLFKLNNDLHTTAKRLPVSFQILAFQLKKSEDREPDDEKVFHWNEDNSIWLDFGRQICSVSVYGKEEARLDFKWDQIEKWEFYDGNEKGTYNLVLNVTKNITNEKTLQSVNYVIKLIIQESSEESANEIYEVLTINAEKDKTHPLSGNFKKSAKVSVPFRSISINSSFSGNVLERHADADDDFPIPIAEDVDKFSMKETIQENVDLTSNFENNCKRGRPPKSNSSDDSSNDSQVQLKTEKKRELKNDKTLNKKDPLKMKNDAPTSMHTAMKAVQQIAASNNRKLEHKKPKTSEALLSEEKTVSGMNRGEDGNSAIQPKKIDLPNSKPKNKNTENRINKMMDKIKSKQKKNVGKDGKKPSAFDEKKIEGSDKTEVKADTANAAAEQQGSIDLQMISIEKEKDEEVSLLSPVKKPHELKKGDNKEEKCKSIELKSVTTKIEGKKKIRTCNKKTEVADGTGDDIVTETSKNYTVYTEKTVIDENFQNIEKTNRRSKELKAGFEEGLKLPTKDNEVTSSSESCSFQKIQKEKQQYNAAERNESVLNCTPKNLTVSSPLQNIGNSDKMAFLDRKRKIDDHIQYDWHLDNQETLINEVEDESFSDEEDNMIILDNLSKLLQKTRFKKKNEKKIKNIFSDSFIENLNFNKENEKLDKFKVRYIQPLQISPTFECKNSPNIFPRLSENSFTFSETLHKANGESNNGRNFENQFQTLYMEDKAKEGYSPLKELKTTKEKKNFNFFNEKNEIRNRQESDTSLKEQGLKNQDLQCIFISLGKIFELKLEEDISNCEKHIDIVKSSLSNIVNDVIKEYEIEL
ncbi:hypothetical protein HK099_000519 [Clydaea vesicula]|uniref:Uncharacterized protein n=1 Tax=Clydaea vesicula TaxID=447962 RepID=A0AAD5U5T8_9FUNG|nr:hypothetical protein HK099_000519 [Clydaea vesicula]